MDTGISRPVIGLLHPGEMGASVGAALTRRGLQVFWASEGRSGQTTQRATSAGLDDAQTIDALARQVDVVFSICPPAAALDVAKQVAEAGYTGLYVDANAIAPETAIAVQSTLRAGGARFVDGDLIGGPLRPGGTTRMYLSGAEAATVAGLFAGSDRAEAIVLGSDDTAASALKMCYAAWTKGTAALLLAIRAAARATGVEAALVSEWQRSQPDVLARVDAARRVIPKAWRFAGEMDEIARCFADVGLPGGFAEAAADVYRTLETRQATDVDLDSALTLILSGPG
jgi:3-hydroxyisobutyrate dehydrogenase-like beta-hydroxyacid dehydrogenase